MKSNPCTCGHSLYNHSLTEDIGTEDGSKAYCVLCGCQDYNGVLKKKGQSTMKQQIEVITLLAYVIAYLQEELSSEVDVARSFSPREIKELTSIAIDAYEGGAR